jgi:hypothetical protein
MVKPDNEVWYRWMEALVVDDQGMIRLVLPWSGFEYEYPLDQLFESPKEAINYLEEEEIERQQNWYLCKITIEVIDA